MPCEHAVLARPSRWPADPIQLPCKHAEFGFSDVWPRAARRRRLSVPIARRLGLSAIVAYLVAGIVIGPYGLAVFGTPESIIPVAELGVVMLLFLIGLELELGRLVAMRRAIFGLGAAQLALTALAIGALAYARRPGRLARRGRRRARAGDVGDRDRAANPGGARPAAAGLRPARLRHPAVPGHGRGAAAGAPAAARAGAASAPRRASATACAPVALIAGAIALIVVAGRYLLNPFFRLLAQTGSREVMTAAALLVVLGAALIMQTAGMSMALGAFLAGVLLAESNYRHELEADIEPFRGLLLALFFMGIGMSIDLRVVRANFWLIVAAAVVITVLKAAIVWLLFRATCVHAAMRCAPARCSPAAGEFAFVLIPLGGALGVLDQRQASLLTAIAAITMLLGPLVATFTDALLRRRWRGPTTASPTISPTRADRCW